MPNEKDKGAVDEFLEQTDEPSEFKPEPIFADKTTETATDVEEDEPKVPYHQDPKVQRYVQKEITKALQGFKPTAVQEFKEAVADDATDVVSAFTAIIGNDTPEKVQALKALERTLRSSDTKAAQRAEEAITAREQRQAEEDARVQAELDQGFEDIEETYGVDLTSNTPTARKLRAEFVDFVQRIAPKNTDGEVVAFPDLQEAFATLQERQKRAAPSNSRSKELASRGVGSSKDASTDSSVKGTSWKDVDRLFSKLG